MKQIKTLTVLIVMSAAVVVGCVTSAKLDPAGVYKGNAFLYNADKALVS